jgi:hypothetical protein
MRQLFGEREGLAYQTGNTRPEGIIEAFDVIGFPSFLRNSFVPLLRNHPGVGVILIRVERGLFLVHQWNLHPQLLGTVTTPITHVKRHHLAGGGVHGDPDPRLVGPLLHATPHLIGFGFQPSKHHVRGTRWNPDM